MHRTLVTNEKLYKWKLKDKELCSFCQEEIETIEHIFLECEVTKHFVHKVLKWCQDQASIVLPITTEQLLFGNKSILILDFILLLTKNIYIFLSLQ